MFKWKNYFALGLVFVLFLGLLTTGTVNAEDKILRATGVVPSRLTPGKMSGAADARVAGAIYDWLVRLKPGTMEIKPELATSWEVSEDAKTWTIELREGVKFQNGDTFDADDVIFTIERTQDPEVGHSLKETFSSVEDIKKINDYKIEIELNKGNAKFMHQFTDFNAAILSEDYDYEELGETAPMGTGPFMMEELNPQESAILVKNPNYWMEGKPELDEIHWSWVDDKTTQIQMLKSGQVDMATELLLDDVALIKNSQDVKTYNVPQSSHVVLYMRADEEPFKDERVRQALKYTINEEDILRSAYGLLYEEVKDVVTVEEHPIAPIYPYYAELEKREQDIDKAKELLDEAGYPDGIDLELYYASNYRVGPEAAIALQQMARPAGFNIQLAGFPRDVYLSKYWLDVNFGMTGWGNRADPVSLLRLAYTTDAPWNESGYSNPEVDELVDEIASEPDEKKRKELYRQLQEIFKEDGAVICINMGRWHGLGKNVEGFKEAATFIGDWRDVTVKN